MSLYLEEWRDYVGRKRFDIKRAGPGEAVTDHIGAGVVVGDKLHWAWYDMPPLDLHELDILVTLLLTAKRGMEHELERRERNA